MAGSPRLIQMPESFLHFTEWPGVGRHAGKSFSTSWPLSRYWEHRLKRIIDDEARELFAPILDRGPIRLPRVDRHAILHGLAMGKQASDLLKDFIFEEVRVAEFPSAPSRKRCLFAFDVSDSPDDLARAINFKPENLNLIEIVPTDGAKVLRASLAELDCSSLPYDQVVEYARRYWRGVDKGSLKTEVLIEGEVQIARVIRVVAARDGDARSTA